VSDHVVGSQVHPVNVWVHREVLFDDVFGCGEDTGFKICAAALKYFFAS
jgi:hypothetical protein